jgi:hypothetical protein
MRSVTRSALWIVPTAIVLFVALYFASAVPTHRLVRACYSRGIKQPIEIWRVVYTPHLRSLRVDSLRSAHSRWLGLWGDRVYDAFDAERWRRNFLDRPEPESDPETMNLPYQPGTCSLYSRVR